MHVAAIENYIIHVFFHAVCTKRKFWSENTTKDICPLSLNQLYTMCPITPQNKGSNEVLSYCIYSTEIKLCQKTPLKISINF